MKTMRILLTTVCLLLFGNFVKGQIEFTRSNYPEAGDNFKIYNADTTTIWEQKGGSNKTWDFNKPLIILDSTKRNFLAPKNTPNGDSFPNAELALFNRQSPNQSMYNYYNITNNMAEIIGQWANVSGQGIELEFPLYYRDPNKVFEFPMQYKDSFKDQYLINDTIKKQIAGSYNLTMEIFTKGNKTVKVDGTGKLNAGSKTFDSVLRIKTRTYDSTHQQIKVLSQNRTVITLTETISYRFQRANSKSPLLEITYTDVQSNQESDSAKTILINKEFKDAHSSGTGLKEKHLIRQFLTFPNPARGKLNFVVSLKNKATLSVQIINTSGQVMLQENYGTISPGNFHNRLSTENLESGIYFLEIRTDEEVRTRKFVVR